MSDTDQEARRLSKALFGIAKSASAVAFTGELAALVLGGWLAVTQVPQWSSTTVLGALALLTFLARSTAERWKEQGDDVLRRLDLADGLGRAVTPHELADFDAGAPALANWLSRGADAAEPYFASRLPPSPARLVENLRESAWWTSHVARTAEWLQRIWITSFAVLGVWSLMVAAMRAGSASSFLAAPGFAVAVLIFLFTDGPYRRVGEFREFREAAARVEMEAGHSLRQPDRITEPDALLLAAQYHLARKGSPLLPAIVWRLRAPRLNRLWAEVARHQAGPAGA
ncbi:MAG TPA: hypothetical protein VEQ60_12370 [Longimicrobium sp.]|nr:hypothetical protein [Longimicrobium sp.]